MKYYVEENVSQSSCTTIRHVVKMLATISETLIFFFLGVVTITTEHEWNWAYILFTLLFAFVWRGIGGTPGLGSELVPPPHWDLLEGSRSLIEISFRHAGSDPDHQSVPNRPAQLHGPVRPRLRGPAGGDLLRPGLHLTR